LALASSAPSLRPLLPFPSPVPPVPLPPPPPHPLHAERARHHHDEAEHLGPRLVTAQVPAHEDRERRLLDAVEDPERGEGARQVEGEEEYPER
ncbi:hypothetical protein THAOC_23602, partial [Thalassiosira oceanica]